MAALFQFGFWVSFHRALGLGSGSVSRRLVVAAVGARRTKNTWPVSFPQEELKKRLTPIQFHVTQERGTERAFSGEWTVQEQQGMYCCVVCGSALFSSKSKFDSGSGWPSFSEVLDQQKISEEQDFSYGLHRVETCCSQCGAHLGHLFHDGPKPTGKRYCINSASLVFNADDTPTPEEEPGAAAGRTTAEL